MFRRLAALVLGGFPAFALSSCMVMRTAEKGYEPSRVVQGGTAYEGELVAEGQGPGLAVSAMIVGGGATSLFGPYRLQVTAYGKAGVHQTFEITRLRFRFANGQSFDFGQEHIPGPALFVAGPYKGELVAVRKARKVFSADPKAEGPAKVEVDAVVRTVHGTQKETLRFVFSPSETVKWETVNVPWEIKRSIWKEERVHPITAWASRVESEP